jgi:putative salt-induced outer membrane protein YdiY
MKTHLLLSQSGSGMRHFLIILVLFTSVSVSAQVNIEDKRLAREQSGLSGSVNFSIDLERGNSELTEIGVKPRLVLRAGRSQWFMLNSYSLVETDEASVVNEGFSHLRYNLSLSDLTVLEALTQYQYNREQDLQLRFLLGAGLRFELIEREKTSLAIGFTGMYEYEELEGGEIIRTPRNSDYVTIRIKRNEYLTLSNTVYVQPAFDDIGDFRVLDDLALTFSLSKWLALTLELSYRYDSEPPEGIKEYDLSLKNGVTVRF